jgi:hypothetical protein
VTRIDRITAIVSFLTAFVVLFLLASALSGQLGPVEFIVVVVAAIPVGLLVSRLARSALGGSRRAA